MDNPVTSFPGARRPGLRAARCCLLCLCVLVHGAAAASADVFQEGLPPALVIEFETTPEGRPSEQDLQAQLARLDKLAGWARERQPQVGWLERLFGSPGAPTAVNVDDIAAHAEQLLGKTVSVHGIYEQSEAADAQFRTDQSLCLINLAEGARPEGFETDDITGLPTRIEGTVEVREGVPVIRAAYIQPSMPLSLVRIARIHELLGEHKAAVDAYLSAEGATRQGASDLGAFAHVSAGRLAYDKLRDKGLAGKHYNTAWTMYLTNVPANVKPHVVWMPDREGEQWERMGVREAIGDPLDALNEENFWYRFVAFFVLLCGGNPALGVLLIAFVVRLVIWPLTKKQLQSAEAMKKLQPQMKELQARFADDKQRFQQEFWKLCQANGVNPLGGCLPLIIQMPVLIMVYKGIRLYIVEFDKASFLWVPNLAGPDLMLLVAYTISMILFQKMTQKTTPQAMDPQQEQQQKMMMYMMPLLFFFMFRSFPAAFILYWLGTNIIYFGQQWTYSRAVARADARAEGGQAAGGSSGGFVGSMVRLLSGEPGAAAGDGPGGEPADGSEADGGRVKETGGEQEAAAEQGKGRKRPAAPAAGGQKSAASAQSTSEPDRRSLEEIRTAQKKAAKQHKRRKRR